MFLDPESSLNNQIHECHAFFGDAKFLKSKSLQVTSYFFVLLYCCAANETAVHISYTRKISIRLTVHHLQLDHNASHAFNHNAVTLDFIVMRSAQIL